MPFPKTEDEMLAAGYTKAGIRQCTGKNCLAVIQWWNTPKGFKLPMDAGTARPHFASCVDRDSFAKKK